MSATQPDPERSIAQASGIPPAEQDWMSADLSRLEEYEPYDWGDCDPLTLGEPVEYVSNAGIVVVTEE